MSEWETLMERLFARGPKAVNYFLHAAGLEKIQHSPSCVWCKS